jgi:hypothetical protein
MFTSRKIVVIFTFLTVLFTLTGCADSSKSGESSKTGALPGTPAFNWAGAKHSWQAGSFLRTTESLSKLTSGSDSEYRARAAAWQLLVTTGLTQGYMETAAAFETGAKATDKNTAVFRKRVNTARAAGKDTVLRAVEVLHFFTDKVKEDTLPFDIGAAAGGASPSEPPALLKITKGVLLAQAEMDGIEAAMLQKGVLTLSTKALGSQQTPGQLSRTPFLIAIASALCDQMALFGPKQLDDPIRQKLIGKEALEAVKSITPQTKESKDLQLKLEKALKPIKTAT